jgi:hypothetical protein
MNGIVTVPAELVADLRRGLRCVLGDAAGAIAEATELPAAQQRRSLYARRRGQLERTLALLDLVGFGDPAEPQAVHIDLRAHRLALGEGLELASLVAQDEIEDAGVFAARGARDRGADGTEKLAGAEPHAGMPADRRLAALRAYAARVAELSAQLDRAEGRVG